VVLLFFGIICMIPGKDDKKPPWNDIFMVLDKKGNKQMKNKYLTIFNEVLLFINNRIILIDAEDLTIVQKYNWR
jgi:hypothetical protein